jgi:RNA polymerase sigma-70 factor (ECF subfamily)
MRIAYNVFYDHIRGEKKEVRGERIDQQHNIPLTSHLSPLTPTLKMDIYQALALLKDEERSCITLQLIDGYPIDQISRITGIGENTVKSHLRRGKEKMANYLKSNGYDR